MNATLFSLEFRRLLRNRRTLLFTVVMPVLFYLAFGASQSYSSEALPHGNVAGLIMLSMGLYGAMTGTTSGGAMVAAERAQGWSRQLRLTPLSPTTYIMTKVATSMLMSALALVAVYITGYFSGAQLDGPLWVVSGLTLWLGSSLFAAYGLFVSYLVPAENAMSLAGPLLALLAFFGGMFMPLTDGSTLDLIGRFTPAYGLARLTQAPVVDATIQWYWIVNILCWLAIFAYGAARGLRRDTARG